MAESDNTITLERKLRELEAENAGLKAEVQKLRTENRRWAKMAGTDALTGLPNKISFMRALVPQAIQLASKTEDTIGFVLLSADNLGVINETHGRSAGDGILKGLGGLMQAILGEESRLGHLDGTHFAVVLSPGTLESARGCANMLRARICAHGFPCADETAQITVSAGIAEVNPPDQFDSRELAERTLQHLNEALYRAKVSGGNRVEACKNNELNNGKGVV